MLVTVERILPVGVELAWERLSRLDALAQWADDVVESPAEPLAVGAVRRARLRKPAYGKDVLVERVTDVGPHRFTYVIEGGIGPLKEIETTWGLRPEEGHTRLIVSSRLEVAGMARLLPFVVNAAWRKQLHDLAEGFARYASRPRREAADGPIPPAPAPAPAPPPRRPR